MLSVAITQLIYLFARRGWKPIVTLAGGLAQKDFSPNFWG